METSSPPNSGPAEAATPAVEPQEDMVNTATPVRKIRRFPILSPSAPPLNRNPAKTSVYPPVIHWMPVSEADSSRPITGTATSMTVTSRITMKYPAHTAGSGAQDPHAGRRAGLRRGGGLAATGRLRERHVPGSVPPAKALQQKAR